MEVELRCIVSSGASGAGGGYVAAVPGAGGGYVAAVPGAGGGYVAAVRVSLRHASELAARTMPGLRLLDTTDVQLCCRSTLWFFL